MHYFGSLGKILTSIGHKSIGDDELASIRVVLGDGPPVCPVCGDDAFCGMAERQYGGAPELIQERWSQAERRTWEERLRGGDETSGERC